MSSESKHPFDFLPAMDRMLRRSYELHDTKGDIDPVWNNDLKTYTKTMFNGVGTYHIGSKGSSIENDKLVDTYEKRFAKEYGAPVVLKPTSMNLSVTPWMKKWMENTHEYYVLTTEVRHDFTLYAWIVINGIIKGDPAEYMKEYDEALVMNKLKS